VICGTPLYRVDNTQTETMTTESCAACEAVITYSDAVHVTVHTKGEKGVVDEFICRDCYETDIAGVVE